MKINSKSSKAVRTSAPTAITPQKRDTEYLPWGIHPAQFVGQTIKASQNGEYRLLHFKVDSKEYALFSGHVKFPTVEAHDGIQIGDEVLLATCWGKKADGRPCMFYAVHSA